MGQFVGPTVNERNTLQSMWNVYSAPGCGKIQKNQFLDLLRAIHREPEDESGCLDAVFQEWDTKRDGLIDWTELLNGMLSCVRSHSDVNS